MKSLFQEWQINQEQVMQIMFFMMICTDRWQLLKRKERVQMWLWDGSRQNYMQIL